MMHIKSSSTLIFQATDDGISGYNFLAGKEFDTDINIFNDLQNLITGATLDTSKLHVYSSALEYGIVVEQGSSHSTKEDEYMEYWKWGVPTAVFHFSLLDREYEGLEYNESVQAQKLKDIPSPNLFLQNSKFTTVVSLEKPSIENKLFEIMAARRTCRDGKSTTVTKRMLGDILYSGLGITGFTENCVGKLPLKMTPSAGARSPYEAYVFVRSVEDLESGIYHYSAAEHNLALIAPMSNYLLSTFIGDQEWANTKNCLVVLIAQFDRTMWKYEDPNAYRAIMVEAGHIAQNMMLAATNAALSLCPSMALAHSKIINAIGGTESILQSPIYALALGSLDAE